MLLMVLEFICLEWGSGVMSVLISEVYIILAPYKI